MPSLPSTDTSNSLDARAKSWNALKRPSYDSSVNTQTTFGNPTCLLQADVMHSIYIHDPQMGKKRKTLLIGWIDDHSRLVPHAEFYFNEDLPALENCFKKALLKRGIPKQIYADNGLIYRSNVLEAICADLGARLSYTQPLRAVGATCWKPTHPRPKARSRSSGTSFSLTSSAKSEPPGSAIWRSSTKPSGHGWRSFTIRKYTPSCLLQAGTGKKPVDAFDTIGNRLILPDPIRLHELFLLRESRVVQPKTSTVSIKGILFEVDPSLRGKRVEVRYDPFDLTKAYIYHRSQRIRTARPYEMNQPPQTTPEQQLPGRRPPSINYLQLLKAQYDELILNQTKLIRYDQIQPSDDFTFQRFLALLANMLTREIQDFDQEELAAAQDLWERFGPLEETISRIALEQAFNFRGYAQHISVYLDFIKIFHLKRRT